MTLQDPMGLAERRACQIAAQHRPTQRLEALVARDDDPVRGQLSEIPEVATTLQYNTNLRRSARVAR